jgi:hypothetical protein
MDAIFAFKEVTADCKAGIVAMIVALSAQCFCVALNILSLASCFAFMILNLKMNN